jgi:hypothetical protein
MLGMSSRVSAAGIIILVSVGWRRKGYGIVQNG